MASLSANAETVRRNLASIEQRVIEACQKSGRDRADVRICAATKYVDATGTQALTEAGLKIAAENRLQDMIEKQTALGDAFEWHFIGAIQSRKIREIAGRVSTIHSLATESARDKLANLDTDLPKILVQVNISGEESKQGVPPDQLADFIAKTPVPVSGLMTMPPLTDDPEGARPYFAQLRELASEHQLPDLSMGTSQDFEVAVEEGATLIRVGSVLFTPQTN